MPSIQDGGAVRGSCIVKKQRAAGRNGCRIGNGYGVGLGAVTMNAKKSAGTDGRYCAGSKKIS